MTFNSRTAGAILLIALGAAPASAQGVVGSTLGSVPNPAPQRPSTPGTDPGGAPVTPTGTATLRGHIFAADSGQPLRKAQVRIVAGEIRENRLTTTDADGKYEFTEVLAGRYTVSASKGSFVNLSYGQLRPFDAGKPLEIRDGQTVERVDIALPRGSVVTGRILDEYGEPMPEVQVALQRYQFMQGQRRLIPAGRRASTDDMGEFRLFGIPPGQYILSATWIHNNIGSSAPPVDNTAYAPVYFPGTNIPAQAQRLTLAIGQQVDEVVMAMRPMKATRISGSVTTSDGKPFAGMLLVAQTDTGGFEMQSAAPVRPDGKFELAGLAPGEYLLRAQSRGGSDEGTETASEKVTAAGEDIADLHLVAIKPSAITGRFVVDPAAAGAPPTLSVGATSMDPSTPNFGGTTSRNSDDGTFVLKAPPGRMRLFLLNSPAGWTIRSVHANSVDVTDTGIEVKANQDVGGVEIELTNRLTSLSGIVTNSRGEAAKDYVAVAFARDRARWTGISRYQMTGRPDQDGRYKITGLPSGDYYIVALESMEPGAAGDPDFLESIRQSATMFSLNEAETKSIDLRLAGSP
jgi:protocatechuate 3,4-dioxygenase beta subunit